jgi:hypothetical protein
MAITPIEDLFTHTLHQAYNRSTLAGASSTNILGVVHYVVEMLKRIVPRTKSVQDTSVLMRALRQCTKLSPVNPSAQGGSYDRSG